MTWKISELNEIAEYIGRGKSPVYDNESALPVLNQACIQHGRLDLSKLKFVSEAHFGSLDDQKKTRQGDIFVNSTGTGTLGRIAYWDSDTAIAYDGHVTLVRLYPEHEPKFFYYLLQAPEIQTHILNNCISGSTNQVELSREPFRRIQLRHPEDWQEQAAIAAILTTVDQAIAQTEALIAKQQRIKAGLLHDLLTRGIDDAGRLRDPATHRFKETAVGLVPVEWEVMRLSDICEFASGGTPSRTVASYWNGSIPWVKTAEVDYCLITETEEYISESGLQNSSAKVFPKGTLLMAIYGEGVTRGKVALLGLDAATNQACLAFFPKPGLNSRFLFYWFTNAYTELRELSHDGSQKNLSATLIGDTFVPIPITVEQENIVATIREFEASLAREQTQLAKLNRLKAGLMQDLLTGRVAVKKDEYHTPVQGDYEIC